MSTYGMGVRNGVNMPTAEWTRLQQILDKSRAEPPTYDQSARKDGHRTDHSRELKKGLEY
ncbi:hypothetical protein IFT37_13800 [Pseudomonas fluorescens]|uniref:hypothetical protein n=1 Tax=Pseudomonas fluorescens group TaxID=136843 RepID=UPI0015E7BAE1|nr:MULTISPECIES: hypothetical protein [Pseudomonas fluorescens group]MBA1427231.1 hypothetical protein [Pseudomonas orientalis]MBD8150622.1 hypothetical protein [Pseudomonas fluorescens]MBD8179413.1 hypothetical protein [Pseudomonas fluorescens]MBD8746177.1 hypothetical protein [Pseudomonas fluorescens]MBD8753151.1 hypothetical protein [Pseudomonas fluorescens]